MENELYNFVIDLRDGGHGMIRAEALRILHGSNFQASNGWLSSFLRQMVGLAVSCVKWLA